MREFSKVVDFKIKRGFFWLFIVIKISVDSSYKQKWTKFRSKEGEVESFFLERVSSKIDKMLRIFKDVCLIDSIFRDFLKERV